jgi:coenzyme PQQ precursor peptide PqqA
MALHAAVNGGARLDCRPHARHIKASAERCFAPDTARERVMAWKKPRVTEVCLGLEINSYASAELA